MREEADRLSRELAASWALKTYMSIFEREGSLKHKAWALVMHDRILNKTKWRIKDA